MPKTNPRFLLLCCLLLTSLVFIGSVINSGNKLDRVSLTNTEKVNEQVQGVQSISSIEPKIETTSITSLSKISTSLEASSTSSKSQTAKKPTSVTSSTQSTSSTTLVAKCAQSDIDKANNAISIGKKIISDQKSKIVNAELIRTNCKIKAYEDMLREQLACPHGAGDCTQCCIDAATTNYNRQINYCDLQYNENVNINRILNDDIDNRTKNLNVVLDWLNSCN